MQPRLDYRKNAPEAYRAMLALERVLAEGPLPSRLRHLVKLRASQINGCAYCIDLHSKEARKDGEAQQRLDLLCAFRESPLFTEAERAALAWTEAVTDVSRTGAPDAAYAALERHFDARQIAALGFVISTINAWNRLAVGFRDLHAVAPEPVTAHAAE
jgi:AhpD family alkylhydroperoxidase